MDLKLGHHAKDGIEVIDVQGEIDMYTAPRLRELLIDLVSKGSYQLVVNLDKVGFLDSTGLGVPGFHAHLVLCDAASPGGSAVMRLPDLCPGLDLCNFSSFLVYRTPVHFVPWRPGSAAARHGGPGAPRAWPGGRPWA